MRLCVEVRASRDENADGGGAPSPCSKVQRRLLFRRPGVDGDSIRQVETHHQVFSARSRAMEGVPAVAVDGQGISSMIKEQLDAI